MKNAPSLAVLMGVLLLVVSCATTPPQKPAQEPAPAAKPEAPKVEEPKPEAAKPEEPKPAPALPEAELARARSLQEKADQYGLGDYAPEDYAAALKDLKDGEDAYGTDNAASKESLDRAIEGFTAVIAKGGALYLSGLQEQCAASKEAADELKAKVAVKEEYAAASALYERALAEQGEGDLEGAAGDFPQAKELFEALAATAREKREAAEAALTAAEDGRVSAEQNASEAESSLETEGFPAAGGNE